jgi:hypothetical protein
MASDVECPVEDCGYTGPVESVEAHISRSVEGDHEGEVGRIYREDLTAQAGGRTDSSADEDELGDGTETDDPMGTILSVEDDAPEQGPTGDGLPVPVGGVDPRIVLAVLSVGALLFLVSRAGSTPTTTADDTQPEVEGGGLAQ